MGSGIYKESMQTKIYAIQLSYTFAFTLPTHNSGHRNQRQSDYIPIIKIMYTFLKIFPIYIIIPSWKSSPFNPASFKYFSTVFLWRTTSRRQFQMFWERMLTFLVLYCDHNFLTKHKTSIQLWIFFRNKISQRSQSDVCKKLTS